LPMQELASGFTCVKIGYFAIIIRNFNVLRGSKVG